MTPSYAPYTYEHPTLGALTGRLSRHPIISPTAETVQFRSVPFATVPERFKLAQPLDTIPAQFDSRTHRDFTQWGYACPQVEQDRDAGGGSLGDDDVRQYDEFACLNCTTTVPKGALEGSLSRLPVMVYLHGGAFVEGCGNIAASHDTGRMVALSVEEGMPVIVVSLHYRLNWFGFFTCSDLLAEARDAGDGFVANLGLRDQRLGFQWVLRQIAGFGGNPGNITAFGESGGSISLTHHLCGDEPLFRRVILQSGIVGGAGPDAEEREKMYERLLEYLKIEERTPEARLRALRAAPVDRLVQAVLDLKAAPAFPYHSDEDPFYSNGPPRWSNIAQQIQDCSWCKEIIIGDSSFEGFMLVNPLLETGDRGRFMSHLRSPFTTPDFEEISKYYGIDPSLPNNLFWTNAARLLGDLTFSEPNDRIARAFASSTHHLYRYQVCLSNPFPGSKYSFVPGHHFIEILYLFLTFLERYPPHRGNFFVEVAKRMARLWIGFANGRVPWEEYRGETGGMVAVFDDVRGFTVRDREEDERLSARDVWGERRYEGWEILSRALERTGDGDAARGAILSAFL